MIESRTPVRASLAALAALFALSAPPAAAAESPSPASAPVSTTSTCGPGAWTQVHWYVTPLWVANYRYRVADGVHVKWRWFSGGIPPYWEGSFTTSGDIWTPPSWYTSVEFTCSSPTSVVITPL